MERLDRGRDDRATLFTSHQRLQGLARLPRRNGDLDCRIRPETVAIRGMTFGVPVADAALYLIEKVEAAHIRQVSEVANEVCDRMLVACAAILLKSCHGLRGPDNVARLVDHWDLLR